MNFLKDLLKQLGLLFSAENIHGVITLDGEDGVFTGEIGLLVDEACAVLVRAGDQPMQAQVVFEVLEGPAEFEDSSQQIVVSTDPVGRASVDVKFREIGGCVILARLVSNPDTIVFFDGRSEGITHRLVIEAPCEISAEVGEIEVAIHAYDYQKQPVKTVDLKLCMDLDKPKTLDKTIYFI